MKATVKYNNVFVTSAYDIETLKKVKKFRPEALVLYKGEGKEKEPVCAIGVSGSNCSASSWLLTTSSSCPTARPPSRRSTSSFVRSWVWPS